jgi:2',3'-cyclic-nucleotide 2'-phosphodiesterase / 3'-nucleotidase
MSFHHLRSLRLSVAVAVAVVFAATVASAQELKLRLLSTTDLHIHIIDYDYYRDAPDDSLGLVRTATLIRQARAEVKNSLLLDSGDTIQGNPLGDFVAKESPMRDGDVHPIIRAMNLLGYDAAAVGNHEFNYGLEFLGKSLAGAKFPYLSANVFREAQDRANAQPFVQPYVILDREFTDEAGATQKLRVGVIGFTPPQIMKWDMAHLTGKVFTIDMVDAANRYVPQMKAAGADVVIVVAHTGFAAGPRQGMDENAAAYLAAVPGVDAVLAGHSHLVFPAPIFSELPGVNIERGTINGVPAVMAGFWGSNVGVVDLTLRREGNAWKRVAGTGSTRAIRKRENNQWVATVEPDPVIAAAAKTEHLGAVDFVRRPVARTNSPINSYFALVQDDPSIQVVTRAQTQFIKTVLAGTPHANLPVLSAGAPFKAGGRGGPNYYTDVPAGDIAIRNVADLYLYPNTVRAVRITGATVREWLEMSAGQFNRIDPAVTTPQPLINQSFPTYNFDVIDGVTYRIDVTQPARYEPNGKIANASARRIVDLRYDGKPIDDQAWFVVATNNYRASGGGNFPGVDGTNIVFETSDTSQEMLKEWLVTQKTIDTRVSPNWSFAPIAAPVKVVFESSPAARKFLAGQTRIADAGDGANGFALYALEMK